MTKKVTNSEAIDIATQFLQGDSDKKLSCLSVSTSLDEERHIWVVSFEFDWDLLPNIIFVFVDIDSGKASSFPHL